MINAPLPRDSDPEDVANVRFGPIVAENAMENAVLTRLADNWSRRAAVKRVEPHLDDEFDPSKSDYPEEILPFHDHPTYQALEPEQRRDLLSWAWIAYNRNTIVAEQRVTNPAFSLVIDGALPGVSSEKLEIALAQVMVDEQYHTLMHLGANAVTRRLRRRTLSDSVLPLSYTAQEHQRLRDASGTSWERNLTTLAFATVAEISINAYLEFAGGESNDPNHQQHCREVAQPG